MSVWVVPATWISGAVVTAAQLNASRDNFLWLKGFADKVTDSTASDAGDDTFLQITKDPLSPHVFRALLTGDTGARFQIDGEGRMSWGDGDGTFDTFLERLTNETVQLTDSILRVTADPLGGQIGVTFGLSADNTYRIAFAKDTEDRGTLYFHDGSSSPPVSSMRGFGAGDIRLVATALRAQLSSSGDTGFGVRLSTDTNDRFSVNGAGTLLWSLGTGGADAAITHPALDVLSTSDQFRALGGVATMVISGHVPTDADVVGAPIDGLLIGRSDTGKLYVRLAATWIILN